jgi:hypothetical protein
MSDVTGSSDDGEDYVYGGSHLPEMKRYPVHDCCEFEDAESLRVSHKDWQRHGRCAGGALRVI